jgi:hypothetical protein
MYDIMHLPNEFLKRKLYIMLFNVSSINLLVLALNGLAIDQNPALPAYQDYNDDVGAKV